MIKGFDADSERVQQLVCQCGGTNTHTGFSKQAHLLSVSFSPKVKVS